MSEDRGSGTGPRILNRILRRLLPGPLGAEACEELERQHAEERARRGVVSAWLWYAAHLFAPSTWALALALRRVARGHREHAAGGPAGPTRGGRRGALGISWLDVKLGLRMLVKYPGLTLVSGLAMSVSIAIGIGCFSFFQDFLMRPTVPLPEGERIVSLGLLGEYGSTERRLLHDFVVWREELELVEDLGAWRLVSKNLISPNERAELVWLAEMSASGFRVARVPPALGRWLLDSDEVEGAPAVIVIGYDVWQTRLGGAPDVIGRTMQLGRTTHTVVGVMPEGFAFPLANDLWIPLRWSPSEHAVLEGTDGAFAFGRLAPGISLEAAQAEINAIMRRRAEALPETHEHLRALVMPYTDTHTGMDNASTGSNMIVRVMLALITMVLLVPFANVAILVYARTATRASEMAVRSALGASRRRVVTQLFVEALVLAGLATVVGLALAFYALGRVDALFALEFGGGTPFRAKSGRDAATILYALGLTVLAAVVAGVVPGLKVTGKSVQASLSRLTGPNGLRLGGSWTALIVLQVGIAVAVIPRAALLGWQAIAMKVTEPAFAPTGLVFAELSETQEAERPSTETGDARAERKLIEEVVRRLEREAGVSAVTYASDLPGYTFRASATVEIEGVPAPIDARGYRVNTTAVANGFFETLGMSIVSGRAFDRRDQEAEAPPVVVSRPFAQRALGGASVVGRRIRYVRRTEIGVEPQPEPWHEIVGVVGELLEYPLLPADVQSDPEIAMDLDGQLAPEVFMPLTPRDRLATASLVIRLASSPADFVPRLHQIVLGVDPTLRLARVSPLADLEHPLGPMMRLIALGLALVMLSILLLSTAGVYALMSFNITQRRREIGIRSALGAHPRRILASIFARAAAQLSLGVAVGLTGAVLLEWITADRLLLTAGPQPGSVLLPLAVSALMLLIGSVAAVGPARRGLRIEPTEALREA